MNDMSHMQGFYAPEKTQSTIDGQKMSVFVKRNYPIIALQRMLRDYNRIMVNIPTEASTARECALIQILTWASAQALLVGLDANDATEHRQAVLQLIWAAVSISNSVAVAEQLMPIERADKEVIATWFSQLITQVRSEFTPRPRIPSLAWLDAKSNHRLWAGAAVGLMASVTDDKRAFGWAMGILREIGEQVLNDGTIPSEMGRGPRSLAYHNFALHAVAILVALADANGEHLSDKDEDSLIRAITFVRANNADPTPIAAMAGKQQNAFALMDAWSGPFALHFFVTRPELSAQLLATFATLNGPLTPKDDYLCQPCFDAMVKQSAQTAH